MLKLEPHSNPATVWESNMAIDNSPFCSMIFPLKCPCITVFPIFSHQTAPVSLWIFDDFPIFSYDLPSHRDDTGATQPPGAQALPSSASRRLALELRATLQRAAALRAEHQCCGVENDETPEL